MRRSGSTGLSGAISRHYYNSYNEAGSLRRLPGRMCRITRSMESRITYENELVERTDEYRMRMDRFTHEDLDTMHMGYRLFEYDGDRLVVERVYEKMDDSDQMELQRFTRSTCMIFPATSFSTFVTG
jgi:hypothetical protein